MLELDLYFDRFIQSGGFSTLTDDELTNYNELLEMDDGDLLQLFQGKVKLTNNNLQWVIDKIRQ